MRRCAVPGIALAFCVLVGLQGLAWAARSILVITGREELLPFALRYRRDDPEPVVGP